MKLNIPDYNNKMFPLFNNSKPKDKTFYQKLEETKEHVVVARIKFDYSRMKNLMSLHEVQQISRTKRLIIDEKIIKPFATFGIVLSEEELKEVNETINKFNNMSLEAKKYFLTRLNT